jgi:hypothetical protein
MQSVKKEKLVERRGGVMSLICFSYTYGDFVFNISLACNNCPEWDGLLSFDKNDGRNS